MQSLDSTAATAVRRLAGVYASLLSVTDATAARERIADAFQALVPCAEVVVYDVGAERDGLVATARRGVSAGTGPSTCQSLPLLAGDELLGVVDLVRAGPGAAFDEAELDLAATLAEAAAIALENSVARQRLELLAQTDPLTGLFNHRHFYDRLEGELARARRSSEPVALVVIDIDDFKRVNDVYGHGIGDTVIVGVGRMLRALVRAGDVVCRVGGEEFAVIMPGCDAAGALAFGDRLTGLLRTTPFPDAGTVTVSAGIAVGPSHAAAPRPLYACADTALRTAKARGKDRALAYEDGGETELPGATTREVRSLAHMKLLQSLAVRLNPLRDPDDIGDAVVEELRGLLAYHSCRVYVVEGGHLRLASAGSAGCSRCDLAARDHGAGEGGEPVADAVATQRSRLVARPGRCTADSESVAVVPLVQGSVAVGAVEVVKLGAEALDTEDVRLLEVLAGHAAAALVNAGLHADLRREAEHAYALVRFSDTITAAGSTAELLDLVVGGIAREVGARRASLWLPDAGSEQVQLRASWGFSRAAATGAVDTDPELAATERAVRQATPSLDRFVPLPVGVCTVADGPVVRATLTLAPLALEPGRPGVIALVVPDLGLDETLLRLLSGLAGSARIAIAKALELDGLRDALEHVAAERDAARQALKSAA